MSKPASREPSMGGGILSATGAAIKYIGLPLFLIYLIRKAVPDLSMDFSPFLNGTIAVGIAMVVVSFVYGYFWRGSEQRFFAGLAGVVLAVIWILVIVGGFDLGARFETFSFRLDMSGMFMIIAAGISLKGVYHFAEYRAYKKELEEQDAMRRNNPYAYQNPNTQPYQDNRPAAYPQQRQYTPPPPPPPEEKAADKATEGMNFRPYHEIASTEDKIEWKKPGENWKIESHTKDDKKD